MKKSVTLIQSGQISSVLNSESAKKSFLSFSILSNENKELLANNGFTQVAEPVLSDEDRDVFLKEYIDLLGQVSSENNSLLWWATDLASRSRFMSMVPDQIYQFLTAARIIKETEAEELIIIDAPDSIVNSLREILANDDVLVNVPGYNLRFTFISIYAFCHRVASVAKHVVRMSYRTFVVKRYLSDRLKEIQAEPQKDCYAIKSFVYDHSFDDQGNYKDAFFGRLPEFLSSSRKVLVFVNILGNLNHCLSEIKKSKDRNIIPLELMLNYKDIFGYGFKILFYRTKINKQLMFQGYYVSGILKYEQIKTHDKIQPYQLYHYPATQHLAENFTLGHFALTYENYPWERMCLMAMRDQSPNTKCVGYQHAIVPQSAVGMFASSKDLDCLPKPDRIVTTGEATKNIIQRYGSWNDMSINEVGVMRSSYLFDLEAFPRRNDKTIFVALEGIFDVYKMFNYVVGQLGNSEYKLIVRTHPVLPLDIISHKLNFNIGDYSNIELSSGHSVKEDIERSSIVTYWGTSLCIDALWLGRPVIHYSTGNVLRYDPLFECDHLKWIVKEASDLKSVIENIQSIDDQLFQDELIRAKDYLKKYFHPATEESLANFVVN